MNFEEFMNSLTDEQKEAMMRAFGSQNTEKEKSKQSPPRGVVGEDFKVRRDNDNLSRGRTQVRAKKNNWYDDGEEAKDVYTPKGERAARNRDKPKKKEVECHVCGRTFQADPRHIFGEYVRCNRCTGR